MLNDDWYLYIYVSAFKSVFDIDIRRIASSLWKLVERMHSVCVYIVLCIYIYISFIILNEAK